VPAGDDDALEASRKKLIDEHQKGMPGAFRQPVTTGGFVLEFSRDDLGQGTAPFWRDALGAEPREARVRGNRAEIGWSDAIQIRRLDLVLLHPDGRELARVAVDSDGSIVLSTTAAVRSWYWVGVECGTEDEAGVTRARPHPRPDWQLLSGAPVPSSWTRDDHWLGGRGYRIDLPLTDGVAGKGSHTLALVDPVSGWAIACEIACP